MTQSSESELNFIKANPIKNDFKALLATFKSTYLTAKVVLASSVLPFAVLHRAVSASASFILLLFIYWKIHITDRQNRTLCFSGSNICPLLFPSFCFCLSYFCLLLLLPPLNHSIDISTCYITFDILSSVTGWLVTTTNISLHFLLYFWTPFISSSSHFCVPFLDRPSSSIFGRQPPQPNLQSSTSGSPPYATILALGE